MYLIEQEDGSIIKCCDDGMNITMLDGNDKEALNSLEPSVEDFSMF